VRIGARDRAIGALVGLAVGDAVGTTLEFRRPGTFTPIDDMVGGGPFRLPAGAWTDDTSMAMCLAESILDTGGLDPADQLRRYVAWWRGGYWSSTGTCFDIGGTTAAALSRFERTGEAIDAVVDEQSAANGSLMRLAAVPIRWHTDIADAADRSGESSRTTHPAGRPVDACRLTGAIIAALIQGADAADVLDADFWQWGDLHPAVDAVARGSWQTKEPPEIRGTGYSVAALEAALWAVGGADDFRSAVLRAANLGDDADTTAAIAGQIAGARWGFSGIPTDWREQIVRAERIAAIASRLHDAAVGAPVEEPWAHDATIHGWWVDPGAVLAGEYPGATTVEGARAKIGLLVDHGVRTFVDLTQPADGLEPYGDHVEHEAHRRGLELQHLAFPIPDMDVRPHDGYDEIVDAIRSSTDAGVVYVHCWGGIGRTSTVVGCLLVDGGLDADAALADIDRRRSATRKAHQPAPQTPSQIDVVRERATRRRAD
jgi:ADP-ribosyl-[dinitrogen reductase] hydrolase